MYISRILFQPGSSNSLKRALIRFGENAEDLYTQIRSDFAPLTTLELFSFSPPDISPVSSKLSNGNIASTSSTSLQVLSEEVESFQPDSHALSLLNRFQVTTDRVLGGMSTASFTAKRYKTFTSGVFSGIVDFVDQAGNIEATARGGFAAIRTKADERVRNFSAFDGLELRVKTDGRVYTLNVKCADYPADALWQCKIKTPPNKWYTVGIPFRDLVLTRRGRIEPDRTPVSSEAISGVGILLADGQNGPFKFEVQWARAVRKITEQEFETVPERLMASSVSSQTLPLSFRKDEISNTSSYSSDQVLSASQHLQKSSPSTISQETEDSKRRERIRAHREALNEAKLEKPAS